MTEENIIKVLRRSIPEMKCKITCSNCCGPVFFTRWEWDQIMDKRIAKTLTCPYCSPAMLCPHGYKPDRLLSEKKGAQIKRILIKLINGYEK